MDPFSGIWSLTPVGLALGMIALLFILFNTGRLYTKRQHDEIVSLLKDSRDEERAGRKSWEDVAHEASGQVSLMAPELKIVGDFFSKVPLTQGTTPNSGHNEVNGGEGHGS
jgi:hypothetical protein